MMNNGGSRGVTSSLGAKRYSNSLMAVTVTPENVKVKNQGSEAESFDG